MYFLGTTMTMDKLFHFSLCCYHNNMYHYHVFNNSITSEWLETDTTSYCGDYRAVTENEKIAKEHTRKTESKKKKNEIKIEKQKKQIMRCEQETTYILNERCTYYQYTRCGILKYEFVAWIKKKIVRTCNNLMSGGWF